MIANSTEAQKALWVGPAVLLRWLWPVFIFCYPLLIWPGISPINRAGVQAVHAWYLGAFVLIGIALEALARPEMRLTDLRLLPSWLWRNKPVMVAWLFGLWALVASAFAPDPASSLVGSGLDSSDSALWMVGLVTVLTLVYIRGQQDSGVFSSALIAVVASTVVLSLVGLVELALGHSLTPWKLTLVDIPAVNFPQKGHLAGWLVVGCAAAAASRAKWAWGAVVFTALAIGATGNRAAFIALAGALAIQIILTVERRRAALMAVVLVASCTAGVGAAYLRQGSATKNVADSGSSVSRKYLWTAAVRGIASRPITGWGGGQFHQYWLHFLNDKEADGFLKAELGERLVKKVDNVLVAKNSDGKTVPRVWEAWKAHNQILDTGVMYGVPGALLYVLILILAIRNAQTWPLRAAIIAYSVFMLFWFAIPNTEGAIWALFGLAMVKQPRRPEAELPTISPALDGPAGATIGM